MSDLLQMFLWGLLGGVIGATITNMGLWYRETLRQRRELAEIRDSYRY